MNMKDGLTGICIAIEDQPVTALGDAFLNRHMLCRHRHPANQWSLCGGEVVECGDMPPGNHQRMRRSLRVEIPKSHDLVVFKKLSGGNRAIGNFTEYAVFHEDEVSGVEES